MPALTNPKHEQFAQLIAKGTSAAKAYREAGYEISDSAVDAAASRLLKHVKVSARIVELGEKVESEVIKLIAIDKQWVIEKLITNVDRALQETPVVIGGKKTGEYTYQGSVANRALELIGKELGMFIDRKELTHTVKPIEEMLTEIEGPR